MTRTSLRWACRVMWLVSLRLQDGGDTVSRSRHVSFHAVKEGVDQGTPIVTDNLSQIRKSVPLQLLARESRPYVSTPSRPSCSLPAPVLALAFMKASR